LDPETVARIDAAIVAGNFDKVIARMTGVGVKTVRSRRVSLGVPFFKAGDNGRSVAHQLSPEPPEDWREQLRAGFAAGESDLSLCRALHVPTPRIAKIRREMGFPVSNLPVGRPTNWREQLRRALALGETNEALCRTMHMGRRRIARLRLEMGFPRANKVVNSSHPSRDPLYSRIQKAMAHITDAFIQQDAISDLYVAILAGEVAENQVEGVARKFAGRVFDSYASKWGAISLDAERGEPGDTYTLHSIIPDRAAEIDMELAHMRGLHANFISR
jgi:hypothetical protein